MGLQPQGLDDFLRCHWGSSFRARVTGRQPLSYITKAMFSDVIDLRDFYDTSLGHIARRMVRREIHRMWPDMRGYRVLGLGYATPYLRGLTGEALASIAVMPSSMGVLPWPDDGPNAACLASDTDLPLPDRSVGRVMMVHYLEQSPNLNSPHIRRRCATRLEIINHAVRGR